MHVLAYACMHAFSCSACSRPLSFSIKIGLLAVLPVIHEDDASGFAPIYSELQWEASACGQGFGFVLFATTHPPIPVSLFVVS